MSSRYLTVREAAINTRVEIIAYNTLCTKTGFLKKKKIETGTGNENWKIILVSKFRRHINIIRPAIVFLFLLFLQREKRLQSESTRLKQYRYS